MKKYLSVLIIMVLLSQLFISTSFASSPPPTNIQYTVDATGFYVFTWDSAGSGLQYNCYKNGLKFAGPTGYLNCGVATSAGETFSFYVTTYDGTTESAPSQTLTLTNGSTPTPTPTATPNASAPSSPTGAQYYDSGSGQVSLSWNSNPESGITYNVYVDGVLDNTTPINGLGYTYLGTGNHVFTLTAVNSSGIESQPTTAALYSTGATPTPSPINSATPSPTNSPAPTASPAPTPCPECVSLANYLACPNWSQYMGDLTNAVAAAIPPPPDWNMVADKIGNAFITKLDAYMGQVPAAPTKSVIQSNVSSSLPTVDNSSSTAQNLVPQVPTDYNQPLNFDLSTAPTIQITDGSRPFTLSDPTANIQHDAPNTMVFPNDPRNSNGGIDNPAPLTNSVIPAPNPVGTPIPAVAMPTPAPASNTGIAVPSGSIGSTAIIPIPSIIP